MDDGTTSFPRWMAVLKDLGFEGFCSIKDLRNAWSMHHPPPHKGVYLVIWDQKNCPKFLDAENVGHLKGKNPNVSAKRLKAEYWVENALIVYVGANRVNQNGNLEKRIKKLINFGKGTGTAHRGGRLMWQIKDSKKLKVCWKEVTDIDPEDERDKILAEFKRAHGKPPFASRPDACRPNRKN